MAYGKMKQSKSKKSRSKYASDLKMNKKIDPIKDKKSTSEGYEY